MITKRDLNLNTMVQSCLFDWFTCAHVTTRRRCCNENVPIRYRCLLWCTPLFNIDGWVLSFSLAAVIYDRNGKLMLREGLYCA